jgi:hypothetical protein
VEISEVSKANEKGANCTYQQKASPKVERVLKGSLPNDLTVYGNKGGLEPVGLESGRYLAFLRRDRDLWVCAQWYSFRRITDETVDWFADDEHRTIKGVPLSEVLQDVQKILEANAPTNTTRRGPRIVFDKTECDLGTLTNADVVTGVFTFQNKGDADLNVKEFASYTGPPIRPVAPGGTDKIQFTVNVRGTKGKVIKHVTIETNDPTNPRIPLTIIVNVYGPGKGE